MNTLKDTIASCVNKIRTLRVPNYIRLLRSEQSGQAAKRASSAPVIMNHILVKLDLRTFARSSVKENTNENVIDGQSRQLDTKHHFA